MLKALIFDVDGTLAETERHGHRRAFNEAFAAAGLPWYWDEDRYGQLLAVAGGKERIAAYLRHDRPGEIPEGEIPALAARLHQDKSQRYQQLLAGDPLPLRPGVVRLLEEARSARVTLAIATTAALPNVIALLTHSLGQEAPQWFTAIVAGDMVPHKKPAPDVYEKVLQDLGRSPGEVVVIEDSDQGLRAARAARLTTVITVNDYTRDQDFTGAALVVNHLGEADRPLTVYQGSLVDRPYFDLAWGEDLLAQSSLSS